MDRNREAPSSVPSSTPYSPPLPLSCTRNSPVAAVPGTPITRYRIWDARYLLYLSAAVRGVSLGTYPSTVMELFLTVPTIAVVRLLRPRCPSLPRRQRPISSQAPQSILRTRDSSAGPWDPQLVPQHIKNMDLLTIDAGGTSRPHLFEYACWGSRSSGGSRPQPYRWLR